jgi:hypothetical protein
MQMRTDLAAIRAEPMNEAYMKFWLNSRLDEFGQRLDKDTAERVWKSMEQGCKLFRIDCPKR